MPADLVALVDDVAAETAALRAILDPLPDASWLLPTPAPGWTIADQVSHLAYFDEVAVTSATDPDAFAAVLARIDSGGVNPDVIAAEHRRLSPAQVRDWFARTRGELLSVFAGLDPADRVPWFGPPMSVASSLTARLMETWAHGQDVADTTGVQRRADGTAPARRAHRRRRPARSATSCTACRCRPSRSRVELVCTVRRAVGVGTGRRSRIRRHRPCTRLLPAGHPGGGTGQDTAA